MTSCCDFCLTILWSKGLNFPTCATNAYRFKMKCEKAQRAPPLSLDKRRKMKSCFTTVIRPFKSKLMPRPKSLESIGPRHLSFLVAFQLVILSSHLLSSPMLTTVLLLKFVPIITSRTYHSSTFFAMGFLWPIITWHLIYSTSYHCWARLCRARQWERCHQARLCCALLWCSAPMATTWSSLCTARLWCVLPWCVDSRPRSWCTLPCCRSAITSVTSGVSENLSSQIWSRDIASFSHIHFLLHYRSWRSLQPAAVKLAARCPPQSFHTALNSLGR